MYLLAGIMEDQHRHPRAHEGIASQSNMLNFFPCPNPPILGTPLNADIWPLPAPTRHLGNKRAETAEGRREAETGANDVGMFTRAGVSTATGRKSGWRSSHLGTFPGLHDFSRTVSGCRKKKKEGAGRDRERVTYTHSCSPTHSHIHSS